MRSGTVAYPEIVEEERKSWFVFPKKKMHLRNYDYQLGFSKAGIFSFLKQAVNGKV